MEEKISVYLLFLVVYFSLCDYLHLSISELVLTLLTKSMQTVSVSGFTTLNRYCEKTLINECIRSPLYSILEILLIHVVFLRKHVIAFFDCQRLSSIMK